MSQLTSSSILSTTGQTKSQENMAPVAAARELLALASPACNKQSASACVLPPLMKTSAGISDDEPVRENHNMKERRRRWVFTLKQQFASFSNNKEMIYSILFHHLK